MSQRDFFPGGKTGNTHALTIAERFYLLNIMINSDDVNAVTRAYVLLTGKRAKSCTGYMKSLVSGERYFKKYRKHKTDEERRKSALESRRAYYERNRSKILDKQRQRRKEKKEQKRQTKRFAEVTDGTCVYDHRKTCPAGNRR